MRPVAHTMEDCLSTFPVAKRAVGSGSLSHVPGALLHREQSVLRRGEPQNVSGLTWTDTRRPYLPQQCLYFLPEPQGQGALRLTFLPASTACFFRGGSLVTLTW
jgi:hypothetical protein